MAVRQARRAKQDFSSFLQLQAIVNQGRKDGADRVRLCMKFPKGEQSVTLSGVQFELYEWYSEWPGYSWVTAKIDELETLLADITGKPA